MDNILLVITIHRHLATQFMHVSKMSTKNGAE